jgi:pimeloyl-ACP methyl ester carboxylesterase
MIKRLPCLLACASVIAIAGCGDDSASKPTATAPAADRTAIEGMFDVGGHKLYLSCRGSGLPTVVYLHGYGTSSSNAGLVPNKLTKRRVCVYDRANAGRSELVDGPLTGEDSVKDLHALLATADIPGPYVLLGSSGGGLIAAMYAATYPDDVTGMVLLDSPLPGEEELGRLIPRYARLKAGDWKRAGDRFDRLTTLRQAQAIEGSEPPVPVTYLAANPLDIPPDWPVDRLTEAVRRMQREFVSGFSPGRLVLVSTPHYMEPLIPDRIAREVERVIAAAA